jgi:hypothetical protein
MKATHFRAYGPAKGLSRRTVDGQKVNVEHDVEDVIAEGKVKDGEAVFDAKGAKISRVVFYSGSGDDAAVVGEVDINKSGKISAEIVED